MVDAQGEVIGLQDYSAYGSVVAQSGLMPSVGYAGMWQHHDSGINLTWYRGYQPVAGRWLYRDPIEEDGGLNLFGYVGGDPVIGVDSSGLFLADALDGVGSYSRGLYRAGGHLYRRSGFDGECEQQRATEDEALLAAALFLLSDRKVAELTFSRTLAWAGGNKAYMAGRFGAGVLVGGGLSRAGPFGFAGGLSMGTMAAMGDALHGVSNGADHPEQVLRNIFGENLPRMELTNPNRTACGCRR